MSNPNPANSRGGPRRATVARSRPAAVRVPGSLLPAVFLVGACVAVPSLGPPSPVTRATLDALHSGPCNGKVAAVLDAYRIPAGSIADLVYASPFAPRRNHAVGPVQSAWMHLKGQPGSLVVDLDPTCGLIQAYTRDGAVLPGVR